MHMMATRNNHVKYFSGNKAWSFSPSPVTVLTELSPSLLFVAEEYHLLGCVAVLSDRLRSFRARRRFSTIRGIEENSSDNIVTGSQMNNRLQFRRADWDFTNF